MVSESAGQQQGGNAWEAEEPDMVNQGPAPQLPADDERRGGGWSEDPHAWYPDDPPLGEKERLTADYERAKTEWFEENVLTAQDADTVTTYDEAAKAHLLATRVYLAEVMGRQPSNAEVGAVWARWLLNDGRADAPQA